MCEMEWYEILFLISVISSIIWNLITKKYGLAFFGTWITAVVGIQIGNCICVGYLDPFFIIAIITSSIPALFMAAITCLPFMMFRYRQEKKKEQKQT